MAVRLIRFEALPASLTGSHPERAETVDIPTENSPQECSDLSTALKKRSEQVSPLRNNCKTNDFDSILATGAKKANDQSKSKGLNQTMSSCYDNAPDGGWGWVVTFSAFMVGVLLDGIPFSFGLFFKELLDHFSATKSQTSWIISVLNGTYLAIGVGLGLLYLPAIVSVGHYFTSKRALATGIAVCGSGIGAFVFAPLSEFLIELYGWQGAMWILAAIVLNGIPIAALLRPLEGSGKTPANSRAVKDKVNIADSDLIATASKEQVIQDRKTEQGTCCNIRAIFDFELLRSPTFLVYGSSCFLCMLGFYIPFTYLPDYAEGLGLTSQKAAILIAIIGITNTCARVLVGWLADRPWTNVLIINSIALLIGGAATMFVPYYHTLLTLAIYSGVFGVSIAVFVSLRSIIMVELLGIEKLTSSFGLVTMCQGLSAFIGAPIAGALSDVMGDYVGAFYLAGAAIALSGAICIPLRRISAWERRRSRSLNAKDFTDIPI